MGDYTDDRRLEAVMRQGGWLYDAATHGFARKKDGHRLWVSWGQAEDALRLADEGEKVIGVMPQSERLARIVNSSDVVNDR
jgi:hypothetical protein